ncbi:MAG TPA: competence/damage-inducible protein A [Gemmatimonadaceae bacterium]|nr:competence/damage-inducible protein A [Gemmatimonadaceae bacterium]
MQVELITIGDELLLGLTIDSNAAWLARELAGIGVQVTWRTTVGDRKEDIQSAVRTALDRSGGVITTGGLGPTADDLTKPAIAELFGRGLHFEPELWEGLRRLWRERGRTGELPEANKQQVMIPDGAAILPNRHGTAPGIWLEDDRGRWVAMLPGIPREMRGLAADEVLPRLRARSNGGALRSRTVRTTGIAESQLPAILGQYAVEIDGMRISYQPSPAGVDLRLTSRDRDVSEADRRLTRAAAELRARIGIPVYGLDDQDLAAVVLQACRDRRWHLTVAESCTGGLLGQRLTSVGGASDVFVGGVIAYDNAVKENLLHVPGADLAAHGAVSEPVARAMARGAREVTGAEVGLSITGVAGPDGGTPEKPVGTVWVAADTPLGVKTYGGRLIGDRAEIRFRATQSVLDLLRRTMTG